MVTPSALEFQNVEFRYPGSHFSFGPMTTTVPRGAKVALVGHNGSGKTTFLRLAALLLEPTQGQVALLDGGGRRRLRVQIGYMGSNDGGWFQRLTGRENLELFFRMRFANLDGLEDEIRLWSDFPMVRQALENRYYQNSTGMRHLLSLIRAFAGSPNLVLLDEPTRSLDANLTSFVLARIRSAKAAVLVASHDAGEVQIFATETLGMQNGKLV